jgi:hypothetical protein
MKEIDPEKMNRFTPREGGDINIESRYHQRVLLYLKVSLA